MSLPKFSKRTLRRTAVILSAFSCCLLSSALLAFSAEPGIAPKGNGSSVPKTRRRATSSSGKDINYYVATNGSDANNGSVRHPWATIQHADSKAKPGDIIHVQPGTYGPYSSQITTYANGTAQARVTYISEPRWGAKLITIANQGWSTAGQYEDIVGFDISAGAVNTTTGLIHGQGANDRYINNRLHDMRWTMCQSGAAILVGGGSDYQEVAGNYIFNIGEAPSAHCNQMHGIYVSTSNNRVQNNIIFNTGGLGIHVWGKSPLNNVIANNTIFANWRGIVVGGDSAPADYNYIANNIVYKDSSYGIYESGSTGSHNTFTHNLVYGNNPDWSLNADSQSGTITADPQFVYFTANSSGDYHLRPTSPAIGRGISDNAPDNDFDLYRRNGSAPDIGAYESISPAIGEQPSAPAQ